MPFLSRDWRSPGEEWVKTEEGWEQKKILECGSSPPRSHNLNASLDEEDKERSSESPSSGSSDEDKENECVRGGQLAASRPRPIPSAGLAPRKAADAGGVGYSPPPHCQITVKPSREVGGYTGFSDVIKRLDFKSALHDARRFNYVCKLLELLINESVMSLSGTAQRVVFSLLEELAHTVSSNKSNLRLLNQMLDNLKTMLMEYYCFGQQLGSSPLWEQHHQAISRIRAVAGQIQLEGAPFELQRLPPECLREVVLRLNDHRDLASSAQAYSVLAEIAEESRIWRQLCQYHFSGQQIQSSLATAGPAAGTLATLAAHPVDWQTLYHRLRRLYGLREEYAEMVHLCRACRCLFWKCFGHPCTVNLARLSADERDRYHIPIPPGTFLAFFSL
ncbi:F-box only protein 32-like [Pollicipes pollicipes]|uniref:F-box only protein 32-like n=1 Tax=Pollicipes pollicipes TaxID=41117 RepID=UPI001884D441|nr:F-box only protein 32-like [Pollicipes pollicipes]